MDCSQDLLELDGEISRINDFKDSNPFLPVLPSLEISEEPLKDGLDTPPVTGGEVVIFTTTCSADNKHPF